MNCGAGDGASAAEANWSADRQRNARDSVFIRETMTAVIWFGAGDIMLRI